MLNIEGVQLELCTTKLKELAITFYMIDMSQGLNWYDIDDFKLEWRKEPFPELLLVKDKSINNIELIEYSLQTEITFCKDDPKTVGTKSPTWILNGIGFELENGYFSVYNGLDENGISIKPDLNSNIRTFKISN